MNVQTVTPRTIRKNIKILVVIDTSTRFVRAVAKPKKKADNNAKAQTDEWISIFGPRENILSDRGPNLIGVVVSATAKRLSERRLTTTAFHTRLNGCVERFNRTLAQNIACFVCTGQSH